MKTKSKAGDMSTRSLDKFAAALQIFVDEQAYARQTQARLEALEQAGLRFSTEDLSRVGHDKDASEKR